MKHAKVMPVSPIHRAIDIHHHILPPAFIDALQKTGHPAAAKSKALGWSPEASLAMMDLAGIESAVVSLSLPGASFDGAEDPAGIARGWNEYAARLIAGHPGRFGAFASLPMLDPQAALRELAYALDILKLDGVQLLSNMRGRYLGDELFEPVLAALNQRKAAVFLHPNTPPAAGYNGFVEFPHEVTRALASLTESGAIERYRRIRYILAYGGGTIPFIAARVTIVGMDVFENFLNIMMRFFRRVRTMQRMSYDLCAATDPYAWVALQGHVKIPRILTGSNFPWTTAEAFSLRQADWRTIACLDQRQHQSIARGNALAMFPHLA